MNLQTPGCLSKIGTVIHEFLHVLGFLHEQNRDDRDKFVIIKKNNIKSGYEVNFAKSKPGETTSFGVGYDFGSVLHYSSNAFSKNGKPTIEAKQKTTERMGQREGFSKRDIEKLKKMYKCGDNSATTEKPSGSSGLGSLLEIFFPGSMDEEEMVHAR